MIILSDSVFWCKLSYLAGTAAVDPHQQLWPDLLGPIRSTANDEGCKPTISTCFYFLSSIQGAAATAVRILFTSVGDSRPCSKQRPRWRLWWLSSRQRSTC
jgi:hypothetical protein